MKRTWPPIVYSCSLAVGFLATSAYLVSRIDVEYWDIYIDWIIYISAAGGLGALILVALADFVVHRWWERPPVSEDEDWLEVPARPSVAQPSSIGIPEARPLQDSKES